MKRFLCLLLIGLILCSEFGCKHSEAYDPEKAYHTARSFSELGDTGADAGLELARAKEMLFRIEHGELTGRHAQEILDARTEAYQKLRTDAAIAYVRYCRDVTNEANKRAYDTLSLQISELSCILVDAALLLTEDPALKDRYDPETIEALKAEDALSDLSVLPLIERERALVGAYEALSDRLFLERGGRTWTGDEILSDPTLSPEAFTDLYEAYLDLFNREAGAICLDLIRVRREIGETLGYGSYAEYRYACLDRDYSPDDAALLSEHVRETLVPVFIKLQRDFYGAAGALYGAVFEQEPTMKRMEDAVTAVLPMLSEPWEYMISHEMYDLGNDFKRMPGSFTTYFATYGAPFLFSAWTGDFETIPTVIHEFGHYASFYLNGEDTDAAGSLDLAEIDAQGLELLTVLRYDTIYGELSEAAETAELFYALYALIDGCVEDAFQQFAYAQPEPTLEALNTEYGRLCAQFGLDTLGTEARSWTRIPHTFQSPFYYISYAASMTAALELYLMGKRDPEAARDAYRTVLLRRNGLPFRKMTEYAGLGDPFDPDRLAKTAHELLRIRQDGGTDDLNGAKGR